MSSRASIVIPAHNEERRIRRLLQSLSDPSILGLYDVYVVCNGCTDKTRQVAEEYAGIVVVEIDGVGKDHALNQGDLLAGDVFPRLYCDADIQVSPSSIEALIEALTTEEIQVAGPTVHYGVQDSVWAVKMYYRSLDSRLMANWRVEHLVGRGLYGASRAARQRFTAFPNMFADDLFFDSQFELAEKKIVAGCVVTIWVPVNVRDLIRGEVRVAEGNHEYRVTGVDHDVSTEHAVRRRPHFELRLKSRMLVLRSWGRQMRPIDVIPILVYLGISSASRLTLAVKKMRGRKILWR
jgi:glycosyltransferase involved in cell wall biosynthesis